MDPNVLLIPGKNQIAQWIAVADTSLYVYEVFLGALDDIRILTLKTPDFVYILSRLLTVGMISTLVGGSLTTKLCLAKPLYLAGECLTAAALPCNAWLFLLRVRAMPYHAWRRATLVICTSLWLTTFTSLLILPSLKVDTIRLTSDRCIYTTTADIRLLGIPFIALSIFDTAVAIATLLGMTRHHPNGSLPARVKSTILMQNMGPLCRAFIQTGYMYYLAMIFIHLTVVFLILCSSVSPLSLTLVAVTSGVFHNIMSCRVFRILRVSQVGRLDNENQSFSSRIHSAITFTDPFSINHRSTTH